MPDRWAGWEPSTDRWRPTRRRTAVVAAGAQDAEGVTVRSDDLTVRARRVIVAVPLAIASQIGYQPTLPIGRLLLHQRMPSGAIVKISVVYDEPIPRLP
jgi:monoamine oxidase